MPANDIFDETSPIGFIFVALDEGASMAVQSTSLSQP